jgi:hypothetical protein
MTIATRITDNSLQFRSVGGLFGFPQVSEILMKQTACEGNENKEFRFSCGAVVPSEWAFQCPHLFTERVEASV